MGLQMTAVTEVGPELPQTSCGSGGETEIFRREIRVGVWGLEEPQREKVGKPRWDFDTRVKCGSHVVCSFMRSKTHTKKPQGTRQRGCVAVVGQRSSVKRREVRT